MNFYLKDIYNISFKEKFQELNSRYIRRNFNQNDKKVFTFLHKYDTV